ncbi:MAG TPA: type I-C CRISPR-associated protein Cas8c/Csd1 [Edaphobacter sp.]|nr:type I-C CRISPR-associated protein Cas8c/Csd1 [Edaphobacter sp.]
MSWMEKLCETYERCAGKEPNGVEPMMPICHTSQQAQIEIVLDGSGAFLRASVLSDKNNTLIPCTEESSGRAGPKPVNHPLCDKLQYVAGDFVEYGGEVTSGFASDPHEPHSAFLQSLKMWATSRNRHPKLDAILGYVERGQVVSDLVKAQVLPVDSLGKLLKRWDAEKETAPAIFKTIQNTQSPEDSFVRWRVEEAVAREVTATWDDRELIHSWISWYQQNQTKRGCCMITGNGATLALQHPAKLRHGGDKAKLISSNDTSGFTFRGRFLDADQAASVSFDVTQKAHNALRWLIKRQAYRSGDQAIVSWAVSGKIPPDLLADTMWLLGQTALKALPKIGSGDTAQAFSLRLAHAIVGYRSNIEPMEDIVVMALDSATPGRMSITFYRELKGSEFLERIEEWHRRYAWLQNFGKDAQFIGAAGPPNIAEAAYGHRLDEKLRKATVERLLPCIVDRLSIPRDLVSSTVQRAVKRAGMEAWEWEKCLGIACGLFKGSYSERNYQMALEQERQSRDYLYGRLLAIADNIESHALSMADEKRDTTAARLMQRFADRPASTWRTIEMALRPYMSRLRAGACSAGFLVAREKLLDEVINSFQSPNFTSDTRLSGEFLLGYHCQREAWRTGPSSYGEGRMSELLTDKN